MIRFINNGSGGGGGGGGANLNIFTQLAEPATKKGIWLQTDKRGEHFVSDDNIFIGGTWSPDYDTPVIPFQMRAGFAISVGTDIFVYLKNSYTVYKYNTINKTWTKLSEPPIMFICGARIGDIIYCFAANNNQQLAYKYDTKTDTYTRIADIPTNYVYGAGAAAVGTDIYLLGGNNYSSAKSLLKYDTINNTWTYKTNCPVNTYCASVVSIGDSLYLMGGSGNDRGVYKYNTITNIWEQMTSLSSSLNSGSIVAIGNDIFIFGDSSYKKSCYRYNVTTETTTALSNIPYNFYYNATPSSGAVVVNNQIYLFGGSDNSTKVQIYNTQNKSYETDNTVVVAQGRTYDIGYNTELLTTELAEEDFQPLFGFADAWFYTLAEGLDGSMPVYYGDGTQWINIKNPPV